MDFESLARFILHTARSNTDQAVTSIDELILAIEENYIPVDLELKKIGYEFKNCRELITFIKFLKYLIETCKFSTNDRVIYTDNFLFGYVIPQINKEFDLLRFGNNYNINIELKSETTIEEQQNQLRKNHFYLNFLSKPTRYFSISPDLSSYIEYIPENNEFINIAPEEFLVLFSQQEVQQFTSDEVNSFFDIKNYLVSPFNDVEKFLEDKYFLTNHQQEIVKEIVENPQNKSVFGIKGNPGTGKSLLVYHIAKKLTQIGKRVVIVHGAKLNDGQRILNNNNFNIVPIKRFDTIMQNTGNYDYIIIDESQRLRENDSTKQLTKLTQTMNSSNALFIISLDGRQTLSPDEKPSNATLLYNYIGKIGQVFSLKDKFRTNPSMSEFIKLLFKTPEQFQKVINTKKNISIKFFHKRDDADTYLDLMDQDKNWEVLNYTKSARRFPRADQELDKLGNYGLNSHEVIGQEFNNVIIPMDTNFEYQNEIFTDKYGNPKTYQVLNTSNSYYPIGNMLYQNLTRTREKLEIVIIENYPLFIQICSLLDSV
ncbi:TPA: DUF2075 domain-containing protein [Streptococcus equi subsp. zooepidemicus]|uniref:DNA/RNA helicase domain-containing protein n=4 Tax=Streptococcus equi TaxID=1336 RepID=UPI001E349837|nr:DNA/RNA helicase domain-containing protein [Streptococcus equi]MCD3405172.1 DUF2075 domain-containing protein [Streptococcus equi subsp. zooepidemicus]HEL0663021.1 DUF2075 domain-containing protein [Streptococcus equi subsp. zooepidemicus]HEL0713722.1 DUF2075 domain-containing protein [Streptococcus equi subsp. zooepidemicus]